MVRFSFARFCRDLSLAFVLAFASAATAQDERAGAPGLDTPPQPTGEPELAVPGDLPFPPGFDDTTPQPGTPDPQTPGDLQSPDGATDPSPFDTQDRSRTPAQQALQQQGAPRPQSDFSIRLARAPKMLGDFFGRSGSTVVVGELHGQAVHQTIASGSAFANDNLSLIELDMSGSGNTVFVGGPAGLTPGSFFLPSIPPPLGDVVTGLTANGTTTGEVFTAVLTTGTADVFDNPLNALPSIDDAPIYNIFEVNTLLLPASNPGDLTGRVRMQDNNSALPQDRFYFDYNHFHNVRLSANGFDVERFVPGVEKTFWDGMASLEVRIPMATTLNSASTAGAAPDTSHSEFGNLTLAPKLLLWATEEEALALGLGIALPTSDDIDVFGAGGGQLLKIHSESVHLIPYLAYLYTPQRSPYFVHAFLTLDVDTNGNPVDANVAGTGLTHVGRLTDQNLLSTSGSIGRYIYRNRCRGSRIKSIAWTTELHYTAAVSDADFINVGAFQIGSPQNDLSLLNGTIGAHVRLQKSTVTMGYTAPITSNDRVFDGEFRFFLNRPF